VRAKPLELEKKLIAKENTIKVNGKMARKMALARKYSLMVCTTKDHGWMEKEKEWEEKLDLMDLSMMESIEKVIVKDMELSFTVMELSTKANGKKISAMDKAKTLSNQEQFTKEPISWERDQAMENILG
jgi:hypothetical protein